MKHLHKFFNHENLPWVKLIWDNYCSNAILLGITKKKTFFWWRGIIKLLDTYKGLAAPEPNNRRTDSFWNDVWNGLVPTLHFQELYSFAEKKNTHSTRLFE